MRTGVLVTLLLAAAAGAAWYYGFAPVPAPPPSAAIATDSPRAAVAPPPFRVTGTLISPGSKVVHLVILDSERRPQGEPVSAKEGETVAAYLVQRIDNHRVYFERDGQLFLMHVGGDRVVLDDAPPPANARQKERTGNFIPPPENIEAIRKDTAVYIEKLKEQPDFKRALEERRRQHLEQQAGAAP